MTKKAIWVTWEKQRRSIELASVLGVEIHILTDNDRLPRFARYIFLSIRTMLLLICLKPQIVFAQNPSMILAFLLCISKDIFEFRLIIDRHSNFKFHTTTKKNLKWKIFHFLSKFTVKHAHLTVVTNQFLLETINSWGGTGYILQDKLPTMNLGEPIILNGEINIVYICSYSDDEPIEEVIESARTIPFNWTIYITGKIKTHRLPARHSIPNNIILTNYLSEKQYQDLLVSADLLLILTKQEHTLTCGAYEAISLLKPFIISDTKALREYFFSGAVYCDTSHSPESISGSIIKGIRNKKQLSLEIQELKNSIEKQWPIRLNQLVNLIE